MKRRTPSFVRALLLLTVAAGPLQAQTVFACSMMGRIMQDECCCEHHTSAHDCEHADCGAAPESSETPCCELSVDIIADPDAWQDGSISKPVELPHFLLPSFETGFTPTAIPLTRGFQSAAPAVYGGSATYLVTQRLRI